MKGTPFLCGSFWGLLWLLNWGWVTGSLGAFFTCGLRSLGSVCLVGTSFLPPECTLCCDCLYGCVDSDALCLLPSDCTLCCDCLDFCVDSDTLCLLPSECTLCCNCLYGCLDSDALCLIPSDCTLCCDCLDFCVDSVMLCWLPLESHTGWDWALSEECEDLGVDSRIFPMLADCRALEKTWFLWNPFLGPLVCGLAVAVLWLPLSWLLSVLAELFSRPSTLGFCGLDRLSSLPVWWPYPWRWWCCFPLSVPPPPEGRIPGLTGLLSKSVFEDFVVKLFG